MTTIAKLKRADKYYYEIGKPLFSDAQYDKLKEKAQKENPKHSYFKSVGHKDVSGIKEKLPVAAGSLNKIRPDDIDDWLKKCKTSTGYVVLGPKVDGQGGELWYKAGKFHRGYTRGDGTIGRVVTNNAQHIQGVRKTLKEKSYSNKKMPIPTDFIVRGEFVMHESIFRKYYRASAEREGYKTSRNYVAGLLNRKVLKKEHIQALRRCTFIAYAAYTLKNKKIQYYPSKKLEHSTLWLYGFTPIDMPFRYPKNHYSFAKDIKSGKYGKHMRSMLPILPVDKKLVTWHNVEDLTPEFLKAQLKLFKAEVDIELDGLVIELDDRKKAEKLGFESNGLNPRWGRSIKLDVTDQETKIGRIGEIEWNISSRRLFKPTVVLKSSLEFKGVSVNRMTAYNAAFVQKYGLRKGTLLKIIRSGDVIPRIMQVKQNGSWIKVKT